MVCFSISSCIPDGCKCFPASQDLVQLLFLGGLLPAAGTAAGQRGARLRPPRGQATQCSSADTQPASQPKPRTDANVGRQLPLERCRLHRSGNPRSQGLQTKGHVLVTGCSLRSSLCCWVSSVCSATTSKTCKEKIHGRGKGRVSSQLPCVKVPGSSMLQLSNGRLLGKETGSKGVAAAALCRYFADRATLLSCFGQADGEALR